MSLVQQLNKIYYDHEWWIKEKLDEEAITLYHKTLLEQGNIITVSDGEKLCGYVEHWRINFGQFGRIICGEPFSALTENVLNGNIAYVANTFIYPEYRKGSVYKLLRNRFFEFNEECAYFVGNARRKKSEPVKVFKRSAIMSLNKQEVASGSREI